jgi:N-acetylglucosamine-6-phosphate deacetylase
MHLEGPWLSTSGKKKGKQKFRNADQARKAREQKESWEELLKRHGIEQEARKQKRAMAAETYKTAEPYRRDTGPKIESKITSWDPCTKPAEKVYTGTKIVGIATMHKSNAVPVFSNEDAIEISKMRR